LYVVLTDPKGERPYAEFTIQQEIASLDLSEVEQLVEALQSLQPAAWFQQGSLAKEEAETLPGFPKQASNNFTESHDVMITGPAELRAWSKNASEGITRRWKEISPGFVKTSNQVLQNIRKNGVLDVQLEVPEWVSRGISNKELTIDKFSGVVREIKTGKTRAWLPESKIGKSLSKAKCIANLITFAVDLAEKHLVDERLKKIQGMVKQLDAKFDAAWRGDFVTGFDLLRQYSIMSTSKGIQLQRTDQHLLPDARVLLLKVCNRNFAYAETCLKNMETQAQDFKGTCLYSSDLADIKPLKELKSELKEFDNACRVADAAHVGISMTFSDSERQGLDDQRITYIQRKGELFKKFRESFGASFREQFKYFNPKISKERREVKNEVKGQAQDADWAIQASIIREVQLLREERPQSPVEIFQQEQPFPISGPIQKHFLQRLRDWIARMIESCASLFHRSG